MYHYTGCGLDNVWLTGGYRESQTPYGKGFAVEDIEGLHRAIGQYLVDCKPVFSGKEFRFLRNELELSQKSFGEIVGKDAQTVALWEKNNNVPIYGDRFIRMIYKHHVGGDSNIVALVEHLNALEKAHFEKLEFDFDQQQACWKNVGT